MVLCSHQLLLKSLKHLLNNFHIECRLINKSLDFLKCGRSGEPISKKLPIYKYFESRHGITNLFLIELSREARALYTCTSQEEFKILQIILEIYETHKEYEKVGGYNKH